jgi:hypothetical protein
MNVEAPPCRGRKIGFRNFLAEIHHQDCQGRGLPKGGEKGFVGSHIAGAAK